jgi:hypothetical protein
MWVSVILICFKADIIPGPKYIFGCISLGTVFTKLFTFIIVQK